MFYNGLRDKDMKTSRKNPSHLDGKNEKFIEHYGNFIDCLPILSLALHFPT